MFHFCKKENFTITVVCLEKIQNLDNEIKNTTQR